MKNNNLFLISLLFITKLSSHFTGWLPAVNLNVCNAVTGLHSHNRTEEFAVDFRMQKNYIVLQLLGKH
jgi:hypothetical protein